MKILLLGMLLTTAISSTGIVNEGIYLGNFDTEFKIANTISTEKGTNSAIKKMNREPVEGPGDIVVTDGPNGNYTFGDCFFTKMCSTNNFLIYYDDGVSKSMAHSYAIEYESIQMFYENLGFRPPKYESEYYSSIHKMRVGLLKNLSTFAPAWRTGEGQMIHTGLPETFDNGQKCGIAHEFMHSIQKSYNTSMAGWIAEGAADWGMFAYTGEECECGGGAIHGFISNNSFLFDSNDNVKYGASFFFITMERMYGAESVREFYDNLESIMGTTYTESGCIRALNATLYKYDSDYGELLNKMHIFSVNPQCYFGSYKTVNSWGKKATEQKMTVLSPNQEITYSGTINPSSGKCVEFALPIDCRGTIHYEISFNINDCISAEYTKSFSGTQDVFKQNHPGQASGVIDLNESFLKDAGFVLTNFSANSVASYSIRYYLASTKLVNKTTSNRWYCAGNMNYFNGHGFTGYYFNTQINLTNLDKSYWGTIRVVGLGNTGSTVLENEDIDFDSTEGVFNIFFRTSDLNPHGAIFVKYTYEKEINIQKKTVYESENYCFNSFQLDSEFIEGRYKLQFSFPTGRVQQYDWGYVSVENCVINANVDCYNTSCYFNYQEGTFLIEFYSDVSNVYGDVDVYYEYETNVQVQSITAIGGKREYVEGEYFDGHEVTVTASYSNGEVRTISDFTIDASYYNPDEDGWHLIIVTYTENRITVRTNYFVHVHKRRLQSISLSGNPQTIFECGEAFNYDGLEVIANYEDGNYEYVSDYSIDNANVNMHEAGTYPVYVSYSKDGITVSASYMIVVEQPPIDPSTLESITLSGNYQTEFAYGEEFNCDGLIVTANYRIGGSEQVTGYEIRTYGFDPYTPGEYPIMVFYSNGGKMVHEFYLVTVGENPHKLESITLSGDYQTVFEVGDEFNYDGLVVTANFSDGTSEIVTDYVVYDDFVDMSCPGECLVMVECIIDGICRDAEYEIVVEEPAPDLVSISLSGDYRRIFTAGEQFCSEGLIVTANYNDGSSSVVTNYTVDSSDVDMDTPGIYLVYVKYSENGKNAKKQYKIKVLEAEQEDGLESITLEGNYKTVFAIGGTFNSDGLKVIAHFADGSETLLKPEEVVVDASQVNMLRRGTYTVTVSFTFKGVTKSATYEVTVKNGKISKDSL